MGVKARRIGTGPAGLGEGIVGRSPVVQALFRRMERVARYDVTVLANEALGAIKDDAINGGAVIIPWVGPPELDSWSLWAEPVPVSRWAFEPESRGRDERRWL